MRRGRGRIFTAAECVDLWRRYKDGESILSIAHELGRRDSSVHKILQRTGVSHLRNDTALRES